MFVTVAKDPRPGEGWGGVIRTDRDSRQHFGDLERGECKCKLFEKLFLPLIFLRKATSKDQYGGLTSNSG